MKTDKIEEVMDQALRGIRVAITDRDCERSDVLNRLFGTLFHAYCNIERLDAEKEILKAQAEVARSEAKSWESGE